MSSPNRSTQRSPQRSNLGSLSSPHAAAPAVSIELNGEPREIPGPCSVAALITSLGFDQHRVAVAVNRTVIPRSRYAAHGLAAGDRVEILEAVGGG